jgi:hypothetical protein
VAKVYRAGRLLQTIDSDLGVPHNFIINLDFDGQDVWVATGKGLGHGIGAGYYPGLKRAEPQPEAAKP